MKTDTKTKITQSIISNQLAFEFNHAIKFTRYYKHKLKNILNNLNKELRKAEREEFELFYDVSEEYTDELYNHQSKLVQQIASIGLEHFSNISSMLDAYLKNPKSINGIVNKIND